MGELVVRGNKTGLLGIGELERGSGTGLACAGGFMVVADLTRGGNYGRGGRCRRKINGRLTDTSRGD